MNFVFFSTILWDSADGAHLPPQIAQELARRGHRITYIETRPSDERDTRGLPINVLALTDLGLSETLTQHARYGLAIGPLQQVAENLDRVLGTLEQPGEPRVAVWFAPFDPFARLLPTLQARGYALFYYPVDDFEAMIRLGYYKHNARAEDYVASRALAIFTISGSVAAKMNRFGKRVHLIPAGINLDEFRTALDANSLPPNLLRGERTLGFWGWISNNTFDAEMVAHIARTRPSWSINLLGMEDPNSQQPLQAQRLKVFQNVRFHDEIPHHRLREYGRCFDACLIPAPDNEFSRGRTPIKVYEYLALHKPVICTHMPQLTGMPYVQVASKPEEFLLEIETALRTPVDAQVVDAYLAAQTWQSRVDCFLKVVNPLVEQQDFSAPAPRENANESLVAESFAADNPGLNWYLTTLETELARYKQRVGALEKWAQELEAIVRVKDQELARVRNFPPVRLARHLRRAWIARARH